MGSEVKKTETLVAKDFTSTWRYKAGLTLIIVGNGILLLGIVIPILGAGAGTVSAMVIGGEIVSLASIVFLGKEGFKAIKKKALGLVKSSYTGTVGPSRHYIGISFLSINLVIHYIVALYLWDAFGASTATTTPPVVWGLDFDQQESMVSWLFLVAEITFLSAIYILGGNWWEKFRNMVIWTAPES